MGYTEGIKLGTTDDVTDFNALGDDDGSLLLLPFSIRDGVYDIFLLGDDGEAMDKEVMGSTEGNELVFNNGPIDGNALEDDDGPLL